MDTERIRRRQSYNFWLNFVRFLKIAHNLDRITIIEITDEVKRMMDRKRAFGSMTQSSYEDESIEQVMEDELPQPKYLRKIQKQVLGG